MYTVVKTKKNRYMVSLCTPRSHKNIYVGVYKSPKVKIDIITDNILIDLTIYNREYKLKEIGIIE